MGRRIQFTITPNTYIYLVMLIFCLPLQWLGAWLLAVFWHELCHCLAVKLCGGDIMEITVSIGGAEMKSTPLPDKRRLLAVLAGPLGGFLLLSVGRWLPRTALCSWLLSCYNLLPLLPLDGGRVLEILLDRSRFFPVVEKMILLVLSIAAVYAAFILRFGILPLLILAILWGKNRNRPCKLRLNRVQ